MRSTSCAHRRRRRVLNEHAQKVVRELRTLPGIGAVTSSSSLVRPEIIVRPDFAKAADLGVTVGSDRRHFAHRARATTIRAGQAQPLAAADPDGRQALRRRTPDFELCWRA